MPQKTMLFLLFHPKPLHKYVGIISPTLCFVNRHTHNNILTHRQTHTHTHTHTHTERERERERERDRESQRERERETTAPSRVSRKANVWYSGLGIGFCVNLVYSTRVSC